MKSSILKVSLLPVIAFVLLAAAACGGGSDDKSQPTAFPTINLQRPTASTGSGQVIITGNTPTPLPTMTPAAARTGDFATLCQKSNEKQFTAPQTVIDPSKKYTATIQTEKGNIVVELAPDVAPVAVNNFVFLSCKGYYDGLTFHRVLNQSDNVSVAQGGDPTGTGRGGPGYTIPDEFNSHTFDTGTLGMATGGPNSAGSQFFICLAPQPSLNGKYTVFGQVTSGMDVVNKLTLRDPSANPTPPPGDKIVTITVQEH